VGRSWVGRSRVGRSQVAAHSRALCCGDSEGDGSVAHPTQLSTSRRHTRWNSCSNVESKLKTPNPAPRLGLADRRTHTLSHTHTHNLTQLTNKQDQAQAGGGHAAERASEAAGGDQERQQVQGDGGQGGGGAQVGIRLHDECMIGLSTALGECQQRQ